MFSAHPLTPTAPIMRVDRMEASPADGGIALTWNVDVIYSSDGRFRFPPANDNSNALYKTIQDTFSRAELVCPYLVRQSIPNPLGPGQSGPPTPVTDWLQGTLKIDTYLENVQIVLNRPTYTFAERAAIQAQQNKYHYLSSTDTSRLFRFNGCEVCQRSPTLWVYTYSWVGEGGISGTLAPDAANGVAIADGAAVQSEDVLVPPLRYAFGNFVVIPSTGNIRPKIKVLYPYALPANGVPTSVDITGYAGASQLPGNPV
jgi:hypothetical protein